MGSVERRPPGDESRSLPWVAENRAQKIAATPELHLASRRLAVAPRPSQTTARRFVGERKGADEQLGERGLWKGLLTPRGGG